MKLNEKKLFLLDMDGTIYLDETVFDGTVDFINRVKEKGGRCLFLTNNSSRGTDKYLEKMDRLGIPACAEDFVTSADATLLYLKKNHGPELCCFVCGTESLKSQLRAGGIRILETPTEDVNMVLLGYDTELTYYKLDSCCRLLMRGCQYVATHPDLVCPVSYGFAPDCGSVIAMLKTATGREPLVIGKPKPEMVFYALEKFGYEKEEACFVGDRLYTDIACGVNAGIDTVFVLSGEGVPGDIEKYGIQPTYTMSGIKELLKEIQ